MGWRWRWVLHIISHDLRSDSVTLYIISVVRDSTHFLRLYVTLYIISVVRDSIHHSGCTWLYTSFWLYATPNIILHDLGSDSVTLYIISWPSLCLFQSGLGLCWVLGSGLGLAALLRKVVCARDNHGNWQYVLQNGICALACDYGVCIWNLQYMS